MSQPFITIIGLEVHVQLATLSKLFCRCSTQFGAEPNTQTCPVCIGMPGSLPVMNRVAYQLALKTAVAINCKIPAFTKWDRKQYFYPDLPKGYQISQFDLPMSENGYLEIKDDKDRFEPKRIGITRAHLEDDAGKSVHDEAHGRADSVIDLNRTGTPLLEIVSEPDLRSSAEARAYLEELKLLLMYLEVSDCNMQEGSLRVDANVNLHLANSDESSPEGDFSNGKVATPIVEIKNMNSFRAVERAIDYEAERQYRVWQETGQKIGEAPKQTRGWDDAAGKTLAQRSKEESSDYRYFPDPDLMPVLSTPAEVEVVRAALGELPASLRARLSTDHGLSTYNANVLVNQGPDMFKYFENVVAASGDYLASCNWVTQEVPYLLKEQETTIREFGSDVPPEELGKLITFVNDGTIPKARAKEALNLLFTDKLKLSGKADVVIDRLGIEQVDESALVTLCQELLDANPKVVEDVKSGKQQAVGSLIGQAKKKNPNVDPGRVREICLELVAQM